MSKDPKFSFIGTLIGAIAGSTSDFSGGRGRVNAQATQDIKNDAFERKLKQNQNASDRIIKDSKTDANKKIVELQKLSNENTNAISGQISKIDAKLNSTISRVSTIETGLGDLNRALKNLSKENGKDEFQKVTFADHEKRIKQLEKVNGVSNTSGGIFDLLGRMSKNKWIRLLAKGGIIGSALAAAGYLTYREFRERGQDREKDIDLIKKRLDSIQDPKSPAGRKAIADAARESKRVKQLSGMELRENKSKLIEQKKRIATKAKEGGNVRFGAIQSIEAELDELQGKQMSSARRNAAVAQILKKNPGLKEQDLSPGYARQVDRARAWEKKDIRKSKRNIRRGAYGTMDDEGEMYDDYGGSFQNGGRNQRQTQDTDLSYRNKYVSRLDEVDTYKLYEKGGWGAIRDHNIRKHIWKAAGVGQNTAASARKKWPGKSHLGSSVKNGRMPPLPTQKPVSWQMSQSGTGLVKQRQQLTGMSAQQHQDYQEKKQFLKFGALPGGFEHVDGNRGILGKPMAVMAGGAQARGSGGGPGGYGGGPGSSSSGTPGGAFTSTQAPSDFVSGRKDAVDVKAYANFGDGSVNVKSNGAVDKQQYYNAAVKRFANSTLNGFVPADGHLYGIITGSPEEWAKLAMQTTQVESSFKTTTTNMADAGGSRGLMQWGNRYGINDKTWKDPNAQLNAFVAAGKKWIVDGGGYINPPKGVKAKRYKGWGGFSAMFSTFRNNKVNNSSAKNVANQLSAGAPKRVDLSPKTPAALADAVKLKKKPPVPLPVQKPNGLQNTIMDRSKEDDGSGRDYGVIQTDLLEELRKKRKSKGQYPWTASDDIDGTDRAKERAEQATFMEHGRMNLSSGAEMTPAQVKEAQKWNRENPGLAQTDPSSFGAWKKATNQGSLTTPSKSISGNLDDAMTTGKTSMSSSDAEKMIRADHAAKDTKGTYDSLAKNLGNKRRQESMKTDRALSARSKAAGGYKSPFNYGIRPAAAKEFGFHHVSNKGSVMAAMTKITTKKGTSTHVNRTIAKDATNFLNDLEARGYKIKSLGGFSHRKNVNNPGAWSTHASGGTLDINPGANPNKSSNTDMPPDVRKLAMLYGFAQLGNDKMHFERVAPSVRKLYLKRLLADGYIGKNHPKIREMVTSGVFKETELKDYKDVGGPNEDYAQSSPFYAQDKIDSMRKSGEIPPSTPNITAAPKPKQAWAATPMNDRYNAMTADGEMSSADALTGMDSNLGRVQGELMQAEETNMQNLSAPAPQPTTSERDAITASMDSELAVDKKTKANDIVTEKKAAKAAGAPGSSTNNGNGGGSPERSFPKAGDAGVGGSSRCWV